MPTVNVRIEVSGDELNVDHGKVANLCDKFFKRCDKLDATPLEVSVAIGLMQQHLLAKYGILPVTQAVVEHIQAMEAIDEEEA